VSFTKEQKMSRSFSAFHFPGSSFFPGASYFFLGASFFFAGFLFLVAALPSLVAVVNTTGLGIVVLELMKTDSGNGVGVWAKYAGVFDP
jgi:hypothetical protein